MTTSTRAITAAVLGVALTAMGGCYYREPFLGVAEPRVEGTTAPGFAPASLDRLAVVVAPVHQSGGQRDAGIERALADEVEAVLLTKGYRLATRTELVPVVDELAIQHSPLTDADAARLGRLLNVPAVLLVDLSDHALVPAGGGHYDYRCGVSAKLVDVERGEVLWVARHNERHYLESPGQEQAVIAPVARGVARAFPAHASAPR